MKVSHENRQLSRELLRRSFTDGMLDEGRIRATVRSIIQNKPRKYLQLLENYQRLLRLEIEKRHATIESAVEINSNVRSEILNGLKTKYGSDVTADFKVSPELLGGMRIRIGSDVWDGTVKDRLQRLQQIL